MKHSIAGNLGCLLAATAIAASTATAGDEAGVITSHSEGLHTREFKRATLGVPSTSTATGARTQPGPNAIEADFKPIFNSIDLTGWDGKPGWWKVEDGALTAESTPEKPCEAANYLIWRGGQPSDFELIADFRLSGAGNSGIQLKEL